MIETRNLNGSNNVMINDYNKKQLPAMPHGVFYNRRQDTIQKHSGLVQIDIDGKHQSAGFDPENVVRDMPRRMWWLVALAALRAFIC